MELLKLSNCASVGIAEIRVSVDELAVLDATLRFAIENLGKLELSDYFGATREEIEAIRYDVKYILGLTEQAKISEISDSS